MILVVALTSSGFFGSRNFKVLAPDNWDKTLRIASLSIRLINLSVSTKEEHHEGDQPEAARSLEGNVQLVSARSGLEVQPDEGSLLVALPRRGSSISLPREVDLAPARVT